MRAAFFDGLAWQLGALMASPDAEVQTSGCIGFAGGMGAMMSRMSRPLRAVLAQDGVPEQVLLERLPATSYLVWHEQLRNSLPQIRNRIEYLLKQDDSQSPREKKRHEGVAAADVRREMSSSGPEDALSRLELEAQVTAWCQRARCTAYEMDVVQLKLQDYSEQEIAAILSRSEDGIAQALQSAKKNGKLFTPPKI